MESRVGSQRNHISKGGEEENKECSKTFKEIISTFPKEEGWSLYQYFFKYQGFWYPDEMVMEGVLSAQQHFRAQPSDIVLCSAPKTGTTWLKALAFAIVSRTSFDDSTNPLLSKLPHECLPHLELYSITSGNRQAGNPLIASHIPYSSLPKTILDSGCKIVYICRDPKDAFVSMYHFFAKLMMSRHMEPLPLEKGFELFSKGLSMYGPYWDDVLGYWRASLDCPDRILFLKYEDMEEDTDFYAKKLAEFIGYPFSLEEEEKGVVQKILRMCSFEYLSNLEVNKNGKVGGNMPWELQNNMFFRKGKVGDWDNYLTQEMAARMDLITEQKLSGSDLIYSRITSRIRKVYLSN